MADRDRTGLQSLVYAQGGPGAAARLAFDGGAVRREQFRHAAGHGNRALGRCLHAFKVEDKPCLPVTRAAHVIQQVIVIRSGAA